MMKHIKYMAIGMSIMLTSIINSAFAEHSSSTINRYYKPGVKRYDIADKGVYNRIGTIKTYNKSTTVQYRNKLNPYIYGVRNGVNGSIPIISMKQISPKAPSINDKTATRFANITLQNGVSKGICTKSSINNMIFEKAYFTIKSTNNTMNYDDIQLIIDNQAYAFNASGKLTVPLNIRLSKCSSLSYDISLAPTNSNAYGTLDGSYKVQLTGVDAWSEKNKKLINPLLKGTLESSAIGFTQVVYEGLGDSIGGVGDAIYGRHLTVSEEAKVLHMRLKPDWTDVYLDSLTVVNTLNNGASEQLEKAILKDDSTGTVLDEAYFINDKAVFSMQNVLIKRRTNASLSVYVKVKNTLSNSINKTFKIDYNTMNLVSSSGYDIDSTMLSIVTQPDIFTLGNGTIAVSKSSLQPTDLVTIAGTPTPVYNFTLTNTSQNVVSVNRMSFAISMNGIDFDGGLSTDDVELMRIHNGSEIGTMMFIPSFSNNIIRLDSTEDIIISPNTSIEYTLKLKMVDVAPYTQNDAIVIQMLGDNTSSTGTLSTLQTANKNFIYSDLSAPMHTMMSSDYRSGDVNMGLPSAFTTLYR